MTTDPNNKSTEQGDENLHEAGTPPAENAEVSNDETTSADTATEETADQEQEA